MVLEALAAVSLASSIVQLADYTTKLISKGNQYYKSADGVLTENRELEAIANNFSTLSRNLAKSSEIFPPIKQLSHEEKALQIIARECETVALEFVAVLNELKVDGAHRKWKSFRQALKTIWQKEDIQAMLHRLRLAREEMVVHLLVVMSTQQQSSSKSILDNNRRMEQNILSAIGQSTIRVGDQVTSLSKKLWKVSDQHNQLNKPSHAEALSQSLKLTEEERVIKAKDDLKHLKERRRRWEQQRRQIVDNWQIENPEGVILQQLSEGVSRAMEEENARTIQNKILHSLYFPQLKERHSRIPKAHAETFNWVLETCSKRSIQWSNLVDWLLNSDSDHNLYWIAGKAGSGKSTLMRYLYDDQRTKIFLHNWAKPKKLVLASCFFWNPGTPMQRSLTGLLLSLLYELLSQCPEWMKVIFPWRWQSYELGILNPGPYTNTELLEAFRKLVNGAGDSSKICFFIDGLDEFEGDDTARIEINDLLKAISNSPNVKVCVSSRPWLTFQDSFAHCPSLLLQDLTYQDIERYVHSELVENVRFSKLKEKDISGCSCLVEEIVNKAAGVFLWVYLVVRSLLQGLQNEDGILDLQRRLRLMPADLEEYFKHMMSTLDSFYLEQARQLFDVAMNAQEHPLSLLTYSFIHEADPDFAIKAEVKMYARAEIDARHQSMERRLNSRCKGLLEVYNTDGEPLFFSRSVDFLHRTVRDFLQTSVVKNMLDEYINNSFDANIVICKAYLAQIKTLAPESVVGNNTVFLRLFRCFVVYARRVERISKVTLSTLLDDLDQSSSILWDRVTPKTRILPPSEEHWTNQLASKGDIESREWWACESSWKNTFISTTLRAGLRLYVKEKLEGDVSLVKEKRGRPLLHYALLPPPTEHEDTLGLSLPDIDMVGIMLEYGADPNQLFEKRTVWGHLLAVLHENVGKLEHEDTWLKAVELLILHKADPRVDIWTSSGTRAAGGRIYRFNEYANVMDVLRSAFEEKHIPRFERMFEEAQKRVSPDKLHKRKFGLFAKFEKLMRI